jgi:hypothetical protein
MDEGNQMVRRVASAIIASIKAQMDGHPIPGDIAPDSWTATGGVIDGETLARAAIEGMKSPTDSMLLACWPLYHPWGENAPKPEDRPNNFAAMQEQVTAYWQAMIDAALTPPPSGECRCLNRLSFPTVKPSWR